MAETALSKQTLIFTYGTLKRGFPNHSLMSDLIARNDAVFLGASTTSRAHPLVRGPHGIPYLIALPGSGLRVRGELYSVSDPGLTRLDDLEGVAVGHYERLRVLVVRDENDVVSAEAYFAHRSFGEALWERNRREGMGEYTQEDACRHVKRRDRPLGGCDILGDVRAFLASSDGN